ncbi:glycyl radical enzyme domain-containing protein [Escherichia coli]
MHCNNVASKLSPAQCLARSRSAIFWHLKQKTICLPQLPAEARRALDEGVICDMFEGHAPYKPRYVLPDYARFWRTVPNGWSWKAQKILMTHSLLTILYHHVPSVTSMPVYLGNWMRCCNRMLEF